ncbi:hypothetical protein LXA43DRAFT_57452 [Ganoderma leucocontextum]|nr:hypothetical protein LXA43DRAFT_57452 [Ganoderma leucocontextum]
MSSCRARLLPTDSQASSSSLRPPTDSSTQRTHPWRSSPHPCNIAYPSFTLLDTPVSPDSRAKSTPPGDQHRQAHHVYPSPPLTDAGLASTIPLPDISGEPSHKQECSSFREEPVDENMIHDGAGYFAPLSPPPTVLVGTSELPEGGQFQDDGHQVESWSYREDPQDGGAGAPLFPPVRDDSGFEEFGPQGGCEDDRNPGGSQGGCTLIEPTSVWMPHSPLSMDEGLHWTYSPSSTLIDVVSLPPSPKPGGLSLELPEVDTSLGFHANHALPLQQPSPLSPVEIPFGQSGPHWFYGDPLGEPLGKTPPSNQHTPLAEEHDHFFPFSHSSLLRPPSTDIDSDYSDTIMPSEDDDSTELLLPSPHRRPLNDLHDTTPPHGDIHLTPMPRSPRSPHFPLADLDMDDPGEAPCSPHSPHSLLPELDGEDEQQHLSMFVDPPMKTIAPSLLEPQPQHAGLGLFLQSDPPMGRSPSPDDDDFGFLDIQLDPESANVEVDEFLALRALRKNALAQERAARMAEAELNERITTAASALLPPSHADTDADAMHVDAIVLDAGEKRARKRELHALMDMRTEARRTRKLQKQRSKEIGALLDFKMHTPMSPMEGLPPLVIGGGGRGWTKTIAHLVAHMVLRRHDRSRPLENKPPATPVRSPTALRRSLSAEDLPLLSSTGVSTGAEGDEDDDDDMEM